MTQEERKEIVSEILKQIRSEFWLTPKIKQENIKANIPALLDMVINTIADFYGIRPEVIKGRYRGGIVPQCRHIYYLVSKHYLNTNISLEIIANHLSPTAKHCNAIHGIRTIQGLMKTEKETMMDVAAIIQLVKDNNN